MKVRPGNDGNPNFSNCVDIPKIGGFSAGANCLLLMVIVENFCHFLFCVITLFVHTCDHNTGALISWIVYKKQEWKSMKDLK